MSFTPLRRARRHGLATGALVLALLGLPAAQAGVPADAAAAGGPLVAVPQPTDRLIVKYREGLPGAAASAASALRAQLHRIARDVGLRHGVQMELLRVGAFDAHVMRLDRRLGHGEIAALARELMATDPAVQYAEPDRILQPQLTPNDTQYGQQWHYFEPTAGLNLPAAWDKSTGAGVVVAVLDTGYRPHADLAANILPGYDMIRDTFVSNDGTARDADASDPGDWTAAGACGGGQPTRDLTSGWHGTHVAGTVAAVTNNGSGVAGVAFGAKVVPVRVLGRCGGYTSDIADGIVWASGGAITGLPANANPARVLNLSLGGSGACDITSQNAINSARSRGAVVVVAAGNSNADASNFSPASCAGVVTVAAVDRSGAKASYSNFGAKVSVAAPGGGTGGAVLSTLNAGTTVPGADSYALYQGTSMATPHVAGVAALMLSRNPALTPDDVAARLKSTARPFPQGCNGCGAGIVNASAAVDAAGGTATPPPPAPATVTEVESNNSLGTAQAVTRPVTVNGTIGSTTDTDWYRVSVGAGQALSATLSPNAGGDYDLYLYNSAGTLLARSINDGRGVADSVSATNGGGATATYYLRVRYFSGSTGSTGGRYTLAVR